MGWRACRIRPDCLSVLARKKTPTPNELPRHQALPRPSAAPAQSPPSVLATGPLPLAGHPHSPWWPALLFARCAVTYSERLGAERVLAVGAHPDDVEIGCGATLLRHSQQGHPVTVLTLSGGAVGGPGRGPADRGCRGGYGDVGATADGGFTGHATGRGSGDDRHHRTGHRCGPADNDVRAFSCRQLSRSPGGAREGVDRRPPRAAGFCYQSPSAQNGFAPSKFVPVDETINAKVAVLEQYRSQSTRHILIRNWSLPQPVTGRGSYPTPDTPNPSKSFAPPNQHDSRSHD